MVNFISLTLWNVYKFFTWTQSCLRKAYENFGTWEVVLSLYNLACMYIEITLTGTV